MPLVFAEALREHVADDPALLAVSADGLRLTRAQLEERVARHAAALAASRVGRGDVVAVFGRSSPDCLILFLACCRVGAIYLGLNPKYKVRELSYIVGDAAPVLVFAMHGADEPEQDEKLLEVLATIDAARDVVVRGTARPGFVLPYGVFLERSGDTEHEEASDPDAPCAMVYTSGSTGSPKGALLSQRSMLRSAHLSFEWLGAGPGSSTVALLPINHAGWLVCECLAPLVAGGTVHFLEQFDSAAVLDLIETEHLTTWLAFPAMLVLAMQTPGFESRDLSSLRRLALGGVPAQEVLAAFQANTAAAAVTSYGLTEASGGAVTASAPEDGKLRPDTIGRVVPGIDFRIADTKGVDVAVGDPGELLIRDECVFLGYRNRPEQTAAALDADGWLHTGDAVAQQRDGTLRLVGRLTEMYKSGGYNVYPTEVEAVIGAHPAVDAIAVVGVPDSTWSEVGFAFVTSRHGNSLETGALLAWARERLANFKVPKRFLVVDELPLLPNGKYDKVTLRDRAIRTLEADGVR